MVLQSLHGVSPKAALGTPEDGVELWLGCGVFSGTNRMPWYGSTALSVHLVTPDPSLWTEVDLSLFTA